MNDKKSVEDRLNSRKWFHSFEIMPGVWTPGKTGKIYPSRTLTNHGILEDLSGKRVLDIGTLDGPYAFEMERRGAAEVIGLDIQRSGQTGFDTAKEILGSKATYVQGNVYDLTSIFGKNAFDIILYFGVWYHLKNPVKAFEEINNVLKTDGTLAAEGACLLNTMDFPGDVKALAKSEIPLSIFHPNGYKGDKYSWYVPNPACVRAWLEATGFSVTKEMFEDSAPHQRMRVTAKKLGGFRVDNPVW